MAYDLYVIKGKKLIDYKPTAEHYRKAALRILQKDCEFLNSKSEMMKFIFLSVRVFSRERREKKYYTYNELNEKIHTMFCLTDLMGNLTPIEFMQLFPIPKEYEGEKYGCKDYFSTIKEVGKYPQCEPIGDKISEFLMEYYNWDIIEFEVAKLCAMSSMRRMLGEKGILEEFAEQQGMPLRTFQEEGNVMVDTETGERFRVKKPKNPLRKLFTVVK